MTRSSASPKFGIVAFSMCLIELVGIWVPFAIVLRIPDFSGPWLLRVFGLLYLAGLLSLPVSIVGLFRDSPRTLALLALVFGVVNIAVCAAPIIG
jgi:hypothetical protein